jgi:2,3-bisphosphoglycerate-independent phosphoglycerate mutase
MARVLLLFLDGVGLGSSDPERNPLAAAPMPALRVLLGGRGLEALTAPYEGPLATLLAVDATLGVDGPPQSASGQGVLLTGRNLPREFGGHYGPKPSPAIAQALTEDSIFHEVVRRGGSAALLNAYPPRYFAAIARRYRMYSSIPMAVHAAGIPLMTAEDLQAGRALAADFTGTGWLLQPDFPPAPTYSPAEAGRKLAELARRCDLAWFDYWLPDYAGHRSTRRETLKLLETFDGVLGGLAEAWDGEQGLIVVTSDHGNLEDSHERSHTLNPVPALLVGPMAMRREFCRHLSDLTDVAPAILRALYGADPAPPDPPTAPQVA